MKMGRVVLICNLSCFVEQSVILGKFFFLSGDLAAIYFVNTQSEERKSKNSSPSDVL